MRQQQQMMMWYLIRFISLRNEFPRSELHAENSTPKIPKNNISVEMVQSSTHNTGTIEAKCRARVQFARLISCVVWHSLTSTHKKFLYHCFVQLSWVIILRFTFPVGFLQNMASIHFWFVADQDVLPWSIYIISVEHEPNHPPLHVPYPVAVRTAVCPGQLEGSDFGSMLDASWYKSWMLSAYELWPNRFRKSNFPLVLDMHS